MKRILGGAVLALVLLSSVATFAQSAPVTTTMKAMIKTIGESSIVVVPSGSKAEVAFDLTAATKRAGTLTAGDSVSLTYYYEKGSRVVTSLTGKSPAGK